MRELRQAARILIRRPVFAITATATIALAIGANTLMFALIRGILLTPLPLPDPDGLVRIEQVHRAGPTNVTGATFGDVKSRARTLGAVAAFRVGPATLSVRDRAIQATAATMTADYFTVVGVRPIAGRAPSADDFHAGAAPVVFISAEIWQRVFDRDPGVVGRTVLVNAASRVVAGVADVPASVPGSADVWLPHPDDAPLLRNRRARLYTVIARLRTGVSAAAASAELEGIAGRIRVEAPEAGADLSLRATPIVARMVAPVRASLLVLWAAVGLLLLIAFANVANLLLMQGSVRARELSLRTALGASRAALVRQLALESATLGLVGGALGAALGSWGIQALRTVLPPSLPRVSDVHADGSVVAFGLIVSLAASVLFGLVPAIHASRRDAAAALRTRDGEGGSSRLRDALVAAEVALTLALLFGAGLLGRSLLRVSQVPLGFDPQGVVTADLSLPKARYDGAAAHALFYSRVIDALAATHDVTAAGVTGALPLSPTAATTMIPQDGRDDQQLAADVIAATPGTFAALRIPLVRGRLMTDRDSAGAAPIALVNETAARQFWPAGVDPIGRTIEMRDWGAPYRATVVGIVADVRQAGPDQPASSAVFYPFAQFPETTLTQTIVVRSDAPIERLVADVRSAVARVDADQPIARAAAMPDRLAAALAPRRFNLQLLGAFAASALLLAAVGIYGIVAFAMSARTREIGVRVALGASPVHIARLTLVRGAAPVAAGVLLGLAGSLAGARVLEGLVFGVQTRDPAALVFAVTLMLAVSLTAVAGPARRALRVDPAVALRAE
jgi:putative ABC transport system permease protein